MLVRAFCLFVATFYFSGAMAAECNYSGHDSFLSRVLAVDSRGGPVYRPAKDTPGSAALPSPLVLHDKEVLLVFDQGPNPAYTRYILDILDHRCAKAVFFFAGKSALAHPGTVQDVLRRGHTIAAGSWSTAPNFASLSSDGAEIEIERGFAAVAKASGGEVAPFFSVPGQTLPPATLDYLKERGVSLWPVDVISGDTEPGLTATKFANRTIERVQQAGKGVIEFHDTQKVTVDALDSILINLKADGFKLVQILPAGNFTPKDDYLTVSASASTAAKTPTGFAASPSSGAFVEEARRQVQRINARHETEQRQHHVDARQEAAERQRRAAARQEAAQRRAHQEAMERRARQEAAERQARQEAAERRARQEAVERQAQAGYSQRNYTPSIWEQPREAEQRRDAGMRQAAAQRRARQEAMERRARQLAAERRAQARHAELMQRRTRELRHQAALRRARQEAAERRARARNAGRVERRRTAERPD
jgi:peptidoglycan/xylan/chitin deacetylase (PgdA/CDA1 family)